MHFVQKKLFGTDKLIDHAQRLESRLREKNWIRRNENTLVCSCLLRKADRSWFVLQKLRKQKNPLSFCLISPRLLGRLTREKKQLMERILYTFAVAAKRQTVKSALQWHWRFTKYTTTRQSAGSDQMMWHKTPAKCTLRDTRGEARTHAPTRSFVEFDQFFIFY